MREIRTSGATRGAGELSLLPPTLPLKALFFDQHQRLENPVVQRTRAHMVVFPPSPIAVEKLRVEIPTANRCVRFFIASTARGLKVTCASPGGDPMHFCEQLYAASTPHSSILTSTPPNEVTVSRRSMTPCDLARRTTSSIG